MTVKDPDWIQSVLARYEQPLIRYAAHITRDFERAREVVQDTFLKLCRRKSSPEDDHLAPWLYTVCRNGALDVRRKEKRMTTIEEAPLRQVPVMPEASAALERNERLAQVLDILGTLPANQQEVLRLKFQGNLSYREISRIVNLSVSNVGFLIHTGLKTIRETIRTRPDNKVARRGK
ncbi:MAG: sigma-70 family RNA polymerase sigma factor [Acidobacteria bacterium]|nr:sigma-70 family RNA polymerase sigma factor [Acidobacteriota bacterium]